MHNFAVYVCKNFSKFTIQHDPYALNPTGDKNQNNHVYEYVNKKAVFYVFINHILIMGCRSNMVSEQNVIEAKS